MQARERYEQIEEQILVSLCRLGVPFQGAGQGGTPLQLPYRVSEGSRSGAALQIVPTAQAQNAGVFVSGRRPLPDAFDAYAGGLSDCRTIARALQLNEDLTEAISLAHDLGHTPFGHAGERALNAVMDGGFRHYEQSVRVVERLENDGRGLNLTYEVRNGIERHTSGEPAQTLEGRIVRLADRVAYINHDIDDAIRAGVLSEEDVPPAIRKRWGRRTTRIDTLVTAIVENSGDDTDGARNRGFTFTSCTPS